MVFAVIVHEIEKPSLRKSGLQPVGRFFEWFNAEPRLANVGVRQFGQGTSALLRDSQVWNLTETEDEMLVAISNGRKLNLAVHIVFGAKISDTKLNDLRRPGLKATKDLLESSNLKIIDSLNVYSTTASVASSRTQEPVSVNGWVVFNASNQQSPVLLSMLLLTAVGVSVERTLVNQAQALVASGGKNLFAYQPILHRLRSWSALPPIDNSELANKYLLLRASLNLGTRRDEALKALELKERNLGLAVTVIGIVAGLLATFLSTRH